MELIKNIWTAKDIDELDNYLATLANPHKVEWSRRILNTALPLKAVSVPQLRLVASQMAKGNFESYLCYGNFSTYEQATLNGLLLTRLSPLSLMNKYLDVYAAHCECWATCDLLSFSHLRRQDEEILFGKARQYVNCNSTFVKRIGYRICFAFIDKPLYISRIFELCSLAQSKSACNSPIDEEVQKIPKLLPPIVPTNPNYYVDMIVAWLLAECFVKQRDITLTYLKGENNLTSFVINKTVSKCRDSFRVSHFDKEMLKSLRR